MSTDLEKLIEENAKGIAENRKAIAELAQAAQAALSISQHTKENLRETEQITRRNAIAIAQLDEKMEQYLADGKLHRQHIATQVDGIRLETRRIVEHLFGNF